ncbi:AmpG family muropeptide MFS transporter [Kiloniella sp. b19]|uniref:AmpG family muropeptide MFS transporter n=1 Tax=Kiloniella sp. GXU_MW_B19 TaxID=3141326 RepID=UPI0031D649FE
MSENTTGPETKSWLESATVYLKPRVVGMLFLGFSAGLPFLLIFSTLNIWLAEAEVSRTEIGFFAWVGLAFSIKVLWAPLADHLTLPVLGKLGKRRSWIILGQAGVITGLLGMASVSPGEDLALMAAFAVLVAFSSATQDIGIDAYRIEAVKDEYQGAMAANYQLGWRLGALVAGAGALYLADAIDWVMTYQIMALLMGVGVLTVVVIREPEHPVEKKEKRSFAQWGQKAVVTPFAEFFKRNGLFAYIILALIGLYKIGDIVMGNMAGPLYIDLGFEKTDIANIAKGLGFAATIFGAYLGGLLITRFGILRILLLGAIMVVVTNLAFGWLSTQGNSLEALSVVIASDSLTGGLAGSVFIAYLSSLTNRSFTATQYALFSSFMTLPGKALSGFSGIIVDNWGYELFFTYSAIMGLPAVALALYFLFRERRYGQAIPLPGSPQG